MFFSKKSNLEKNQIFKKFENRYFLYQFYSEFDAKSKSAIFTRFNIMGDICRAYGLFWYQLVGWIWSKLLRAGTGPLF